MNAQQLRKVVGESLEALESGRVQAGIEVLKSIPPPARRASAREAGAGERMTRFCPGCGSVGPVDPRHRDCCPDGSKARMVPESIAAHMHGVWEIALAASVAKQAGMVLMPTDPAPLQIESGAACIEREVANSHGQVSPRGLAHAVYVAMVVKPQSESKNPEQKN